MYGVHICEIMYNICKIYMWYIFSIYEVFMYNIKQKFICRSGIVFIQQFCSIKEIAQYSNINAVSSYEVFTIVNSLVQQY